MSVLIVLREIISGKVRVIGPWTKNVLIDAIGLIELICNRIVATNMYENINELN